MSLSAIGLGDAPELRPLVHRTRAGELLLATALLAAAIGVAAIARNRTQVSQTPILASGSNAIVVLDLSASTQSDTLKRAYSTLTLLGRSRARVGLVIFSSYAYEALPPGSPAANLLPFARFFQPVRTQSSFAARLTFPRNPWQTSFSFGTEISSGLALARSLILRDRLQQPTVVLVSDLFDDANDLPRVTAVGQSYRRLGVPLRIVALNPSVGDLRFFLNLAGPGTSLLQGQLPKQAHLAAKSSFPTALALAALLLVGLLVLNELLHAPLRWTSGAPAAEAGP